MYTAQGFHLLEMMITLCIVVLLASMSFTSYTKHITNSRRLEAKIALTQLSNALESYYFSYHTYEEANIISLKQTEWTNGKHYHLVIQNKGVNHYYLLAIPRGRQAENDKKCGTLILTESGEKKITGEREALLCW